MPSEEANGEGPKFAATPAPFGMELFSQLPESDQSSSPVPLVHVPEVVSPIVTITELVVLLPNV